MEYKEKEIIIITSIYEDKEPTQTYDSKKKLHNNMFWVWL